MPDRHRRHDHDRREERRAPIAGPDPDVAVEAEAEREHRDEGEELERPDLADQADHRKGRDVRKTRVVVERGHSGGPDVEPVLVWEPVGDELQARQVLVCIDPLRKSGPGAQEQAEDEYDDRDARGRRDLASPSGHPALRPRRIPRTTRTSPVRVATPRPARKSRWTRRSSSTMCEPAGSVRPSIPSASGPAVTLFPSTDACHPLSYDSRTMRSPGAWLSTRQCPRPFTAVTGAVPRVTAVR